MKSIRPLEQSDLPVACEIINQSATAYRGVIPADCWHEPYMPIADLEADATNGVKFYGRLIDGRFVGIMGIQNVKDVTLIRHAYVRTEHRNHGIGRELLEFVTGLTTRPILIGAWNAAHWAVRFYERNGFILCGEEETKVLLRTYWTITDRQLDESVVLANARWPLHRVSN